MLYPELFSELQYKGDESIYLQCEKQKVWQLEASSRSCLSGQTHELRLKLGMKQHLGSPQCQDGLGHSPGQAHSSRDFLLTRAATPAQISEQRGLGAEPQLLLHFPAVNWFHRPQ